MEEGRTAVLLVMEIRQAHLHHKAITVLLLLPLTQVEVVAQPEQEAEQVGATELRPRLLALLYLMLVVAVDQPM